MAAGSVWRRLPARGYSHLNLLLYGVIALGVLGMLGGITYKVRQGGYDACKVEWSEANLEAQKQSDAKALEDRQAKEKADAENLAAISKLMSDIRRVRDERDRKPNVVPAAPASSKCPPDQACFDRAGLESALRDYRAEIRGLADQAAALETDLNTARKWAQSR